MEQLPTLADQNSRTVAIYTDSKVTLASLKIKIPYTASSLKKYEIRYDTLQCKTGQFTSGG